MTSREETIEAIVAIELEMFVAVNGEENAACQEDPASFGLHRRAQFAPWSPSTLESYLGDLMQAQSENVNLMWLKYARMEGLISPLSANPLVDEIVDIATAWQRDLFDRYPALMSGARPLTDAEAQAEITSFATYARAEYETYSDRTLESLRADMEASLANGVNQSEVIYEHLVREAGLSSLDEAELRHAARLLSSE